MTGERWFAVGLLGLVLAGGTVFVVDQLLFCGQRCTQGVSSAAEAARQARERGIVQVPVPQCDGTGDQVATTALDPPAEATALTTLDAAAADGGRVLVGDAGGGLWVAPATDPAALEPLVGPDGPLQVSGRVVGLSPVGTDPAQLLVATTAPARVLALDAATGEQRAQWSLPGEPVAVTGAGPRAVVLTADGDALSTTPTSSAGQTWNELTPLGVAGRFSGATSMATAGTTGTAAATLLLSGGDELRQVQATNGLSRLVASEGPGVDEPSVDGSPPLTRAATLGLVDGQVLLLDDGAVRPASPDPQFRGVGVGVASPAPALVDPVAATTADQQLVVLRADGGLLLLDPPAC